MKDTVAILGSHPATRGQFDYGRDDCDIWVFNEALKDDFFKRADAVFQMHIPSIWRNPQNRNDPHHYEWLKSGDTPPIYMMEGYQEVPKAVEYPLDEVQRLLARFNHPKYFTSSIAFSLALAILKGYKRIEMYGVEMETETEYFFQRDGVAFWVGYALGKGIEVYTPCGIFDTPLYAYEGNITIPVKDYERRVAELLVQREAKEKQYIEAEAKAIDAISRYIANPVNGEEVIANIQQQSALASEYGLVDGAAQENERYMAKVNAMMDAAGDYVIVRQEYEQSRQTRTQQWEQASAAFNAMAGQLQVFLGDIYKTKSAVKRKTRGKVFMGALRKTIETATLMGMSAGAARENLRWLQQVDKLIRAAGGEKSYQVLMEQKNESMVAQN